MNNGGKQEEEWESMNEVICAKPPSKIFCNNQFPPSHRSSYKFLFRIVVVWGKDTKCWRSTSFLIFQYRFSSLFAVLILEVTSQTKKRHRFVDVCQIKLKLKYFEIVFKFYEVDFGYA